MPRNLVKVAFDATACLGNRTGVGTFATEVLTRLARRDDLEMVAFAVSWRGRNRLREVCPDGVRTMARPAPARPLRAAWMRIDGPVAEWFTGPVDIVHGPNFVVPPTRRAAAVVTVHDLTPVRYPELCSPDTLAYPKLIDRAVRRGAWVQTSSQFVADEIRERFPVDPDRLVVIGDGVNPPGPPPRLEEVSPAVRRIVADGGPFLLALGTIEPRKDLPALVEAFAAVARARPNLRLVVAGPDGWGVESLESAIAANPHRDRITRLGWVTDADRATLLQRAEVLVYPSRYEGFGLPPLEAMATGTPVVATDAGALPEVLGDAATTVSAAALSHDRPEGIRALADAIDEVLDDDARTRADRVDRGRARAAIWSWDDTAAGVAAMYRRIVSAS